MARQVTSVTKQGKHEPFELQVSEGVQDLKMLYEDELQRALQNDGSSSSLFVTPRTYYPEI